MAQSKLQATSKIFFILNLLIATSFNINAQTTIQHKVFLLGNLVDVEDHPALANQLNQLFNKTSASFTLILNGDLVDQKIEKKGNTDQINPIFNLIDLVQKYPNGNLIIVPGDRDWNSSKKGGAKSLNQLESRVKKYWKGKNYTRCHWAGDDGCPGPEVYEMGESLVIVALNTQWWNHPYDKPRGSDAICDGLTADNLKEEIEDAIEENLDKNVLLIGHHPIFSLGNYGGYFSVGQQMSPFPILGSFRTAFHANAGNTYDLANPRLHVFIENMKNLLHFHENLIYATGHEKNQQILTFGNNYMINSGAPSRAKYATKNENTIYSARESGIMALTYYDNGKVEATLWQNDGNNNMQPIENNPLFESACETPADNKLMLNTAYVPCKDEIKTKSKMQSSYTKPIQIIAGVEYDASKWKRIWLGNHYRNSWMTTVQTNYLNLDTTFGGLTIYKKGGGRQTTSLKFKSGNGTEYTFRSVNKDPTKALDYHLRNTFAADVIRDQTSTQHPYGAMAVASLLNEIDILHANPVLYRLPDDPKLGPFQAKYGHLLGMLEENPGKKNNKGEIFGGADKIHKSTKMYKRFYNRQKTKIQQEEFVRARIFDMLIGDWSKHEDNWKWAVYDEDGFRTYRPIPRDRDHAFSRQDGVINWLADRPFGVQNLQNFGHNFEGIRSLTFQARHMDRFLLDEAPRSVFMAQAKYIQAHISDADIEKAVRNMPPEIYEKSGKIIEAKLKNRIKHLDEAAEVYYKLMAKEVDITGSNEKEYFIVEYNKDGTVQVRIFDTKKNKKGETLLYNRTFHPKETKKIRLWALGNDDFFDIRGEKGKIKVSVFGGPGEDVFIDNASAKTRLYDKGKSSSYQVNGNAKVVNHWNKKLYEYDRKRFGYNHSIPIVYAAYTSTSGFGLNLGYNFTIRKFEKDSYHSTHSIGLGFTTEGNNKAFYNGRFHQAIREWDFLLSLSADDSSIRNRFFGIGNDSENKTDEFGIDYFQPVISNYHFSLGLMRNFWQKSSLQFKLGIERDESKVVENTFLSNNFEAIYGAHQKLTSIPIQFALDLDFRDEIGLPYRGARALFTYQNNTLLNEVDAGNNFGVARGEIEYYLSSRRKHPLTLGFRIGGAISHGDVPWYKLPILGTTHGLRGYVNERFVGKSSAFINTEFRYQLIERNTAVVPIKAGIKVFFDYGRVFQGDIPESNDWRYGYGIGFYLVPLDESITFSLSFGFSEEESFYPNFSVGTPLR